MVYLVLDRLEGGSVEGLLKQEGHIEENHAAYIIAQVVDAVRYCHGLGIAASVCPSHSENEELGTGPWPGGEEA